jgi:ferredoxin
MPTLRVQGIADPIEVRDNGSILDAVMESSIPIATACGGVAACGLCRVTVHKGGDLLTPFNRRESEHLGNLAERAGRRLACQARFVQDGEVEVEIPPVADRAADKQEKWTRMMRERRQRQATEQKQKHQQRQQRRQGGGEQSREPGDGKRSRRGRRRRSRKR